MNTAEYRQVRQWIGFACLLGAIGLIAPRVCADDVKTCVKRVPMPAAPASRLPRDLVYSAVLHKWSMNAWWSVTTTRANLYETTPAGSGLMVAFMSPELIAASTNVEAVTQRLSADDAQLLYEENLKRYYGDKIAFSGYIQIDQFNAGLDAIDSDWAFYLITEDGKQYRPSRVNLGRFYHHDLNREGTTITRKDVTVVFENLDPKTGQPLFTSTTPSLTLAMAGAPGQVKARFAFNVKKKR